MARIYVAKQSDLQALESRVAVLEGSVPPPDMTPPNTTIISGPSNGIATTADITFTSDGPAATFEGRLNGGAWAVVTSPVHLTGLTVSDYVYEVRARDASNNVDPTPASVTWTVLADLYIRITTTGASFAPSIELAGGSTATVSWLVEESGATATGLTPTLNFGSVVTRHIQMRVNDDGEDVLDQVRTFNLGFDHTQDAGRFNMGDAYDWPAQFVSAIENVNLMSGMVRFASSNNNLASVLDFSGCSDLEHIECFSSAVQGVNLAGCIALIRLCLEECNLQQPLNLNPVANNLRDLRASTQQSGTLVFVPQTIPLVALYHECIRDQTVINRPAASMIPVVEEEWIWNCGQTGAYVNGSLLGGSVSAEDNDYTSADMTGRFPASESGSLSFRLNQLTSINLTGCEGAWQLHLTGNQFDQSAIDLILDTVEAWGTSNGDLRLDGVGNAAPSSAGLANVALLEGRGWAVLVNASVSAPSNSSVPTISGTTISGSLLTATPGTWTNSPTSYAYQWQESSNGGGTWSDQAGVVGNSKSLGLGDVGKTLRVLVIAANAGGLSSPAFSMATAMITEPSGSLWEWEDDFERADVTGLVAVNNNWFDPSGVVTADIASNRLVRTDNLSYQRLLNRGDTLAPADYTVEVDLPQWGTLGWTDTTFFGMVIRQETGWDNGIRVLLHSLTSLTIGDAGGFGVDNQTLPTVNYPASWTNMSAPSHTMALRAVGDQITVILDGVEAVTITYAKQVGRTGTAFGICGPGGNRAYMAIRAYV